MRLTLLHRPYTNLLTAWLLFYLPNITLAQSISLLTDEWCPYTCELNSDKPGILVEVANKVFSQDDIDIDYQMVNWARAIKKVRVGKGDALLGAYKSDSPDFIFHTSPILYSQMCFFVQANDPWLYTGLNSLLERQLSVVNGYSYGELFDQYMLQHPKNFILLTGDELLNRASFMLYKKRIDTILEDKYVFHEEQLAGHLKVAGCLAKEGVYIAFSPAHKARSQALVILIDAKLVELKAQGEIEKIIAKYYEP